MSADPLIAALVRHRDLFHPVVPFDRAAEKLYRFDFTSGNTTLTPELIADTDRFARYINRALEEQGAKYGIGGYGENRTLYGRSRHFDQVLRSAETEPAGREPEPRRLHLGIDIWGPAGTRVMAPLEAVVHSFAFNNRDSDYGATLILTHRLDGIGFHTLYGHLSLNSLKNLFEGKSISRGDVIAEFGMRFENGNWPPHLHFQVINDMEDWKGDYKHDVSGKMTIV
jgi:murein DD-endopeptidase MepM/ murein hydrolase activator NlpD